MSEEIKYTPHFDVKPLPPQKGYVDPDTGKFSAEPVRAITVDDWLQAQNTIAALKTDLNKAVELLRRALPFVVGPSMAIEDDIRAFLAERGEGAKQSFLEQGKAHLRKVAAMTKELEAARKVCEGIVLAIRQGVPSEAAGLATEFLATQTKEPRDE